MTSSRDDPSSQDLGARLEKLGRSLGERETTAALGELMEHFLEEATAP